MNTKLEKELLAAVGILFLNDLITYKESVRIQAKIQKWQDENDRNKRNK